MTAAGGPLRLHNDHMRTFDARAPLRRVWQRGDGEDVARAPLAAPSTSSARGLLATHADVLKADSVLDAFSPSGRAVTL